MDINFSSNINPYANSYNKHSQNSRNIVNPDTQSQKEQVSNDYNDSQVRMEKRAGKIECETCSSRKYQDGSDDPGVSFKAAAHIDPDNSASVVMSHEQEHVTNERAKASLEGRKIVSQSVKLFSSVCPECGKAYISGGVTNTVSKADNKDSESDYFKKNYEKIMSGSFGKEIDVRL